MKIRTFQNEDASFCFKTRSAAFIQKFYNELGAEIVTLCVNAYMPQDYINFSDKMKIFIVEEKGKEVGFVTVKRITKQTAEIPLIYFKLDKIGKVYGKRSMEFIEEWVKTNWEEVNKIFLDTIIPKYNGDFYTKLKYNRIGESTCTFSGHKVKAVRFEKYIW